MQALNRLINGTFLADMKAQPHCYNRRDVRLLQAQTADQSLSWNLASTVIDRFQWRVVGLSSLLTVKDGKKHWSLHGCGLVTGADLKLTFSEAGFDYNFSFTVGEERKKVDGITRPVYDPRTAQFSINVGTSAGKRPDFVALDNDIEQFLTMTSLKMTV